MLRINAVSHAFRTRIFSGEAMQVKDLADKSWVIAPEEAVKVPSAVYLEGQLDRVQACEFTDESPAVQVAERTKYHDATRCFMVRDAVLIDGALYKGKARTFIAERKRRLPSIFVEREIECAALYCSPIGIKYFGSWLIDDCPTYLLANERGPPTTIDMASSIHASQYESMLSMKPIRLDNAYIRKVFLFDDFSQNSNKGLRFLQLKEAILRTVGQIVRHPGAFILRGSHGVRRVLKNELDLANHLKKKRGFKIIDPMRMDAFSIAKECAGSSVVIGVEGSALMHGVSVLDRGGTVFALQPPSRFVSVYKNLTDRDGQKFAFVVGTSEDKYGDFLISLDEVEKTLDLLPDA